MCNRHHVRLGASAAQRVHRRTLTCVSRTSKHHSSGTRSTRRVPPSVERLDDATRTRAEQKSRTRQALLDQTLELVGERSFASISLREVTKRAGIVPTAFYRHFASMEEVGVTLVEDSMRTLRRMLRDGRRDLAARAAVPTAKESLAVLVRQARANEAQFRFLVREQYGGISEVRRAIDTELKLFSRELAIDLSRIPELAKWPADDLEVAGDLIVTVMLHAVAELVELDRRNTREEDELILRTEKQLVIAFLGMGRWQPSHE
ncbi:TetR family transcriptional regulator [Williamsia limnetica]|uniref:TetR family transcriptional regulator n=1 Tax=Williamsia limnetica TaxID=882452 RepID=A0A318RQY9_WILLI|nr:TetR family transcriptional regulator [Williamsia limnetica]